MSHFTKFWRPTDVKETRGHPGAVLGVQTVRARMRDRAFQRQQSKKKRDTGGHYVSPSSDETAYCMQPVQGTDMRGCVPGRRA